MPGVPRFKAFWKLMSMIKLKIWNDCFFDREHSHYRRGKDKKETVTLVLNSPKRHFFRIISLSGAWWEGNVVVLAVVRLFICMQCKVIHLFPVNRHHQIHPLKLFQRFRTVRWNTNLTCYPIWFDAILCMCCAKTSYTNTFVQGWKNQTEIY